MSENKPKVNMLACFWMLNVVAIVMISLPLDLIEAFLNKGAAQTAAPLLLLNAIMAAMSLWPITARMTTEQALSFQSIKNIAWMCWLWPIVKRVSRA